MQKLISLILLISATLSFSMEKTKVIENGQKSINKLQAIVTEIEKDPTKEKLLANETQKLWTANKALFTAYVTQDKNKASQEYRECLSACDKLKMVFGDKEKDVSKIIATFEIMQYLARSIDLQESNSNIEIPKNSIFHPTNIPQLQQADEKVIRNALVTEFKNIDLPMFVLLYKNKNSSDAIEQKVTSGIGNFHNEINTLFNTSISLKHFKLYRAFSEITKDEMHALTQISPSPEYACGCNLL